MPPVILNGSAGVTTNSGAEYNGIASSTAVASTSGTSIDFTGIPSWVRRITVMFAGVSTSGSSLVIAQIGSGSFTTSGYLGSTAISATPTALTTGMGTGGFNAAAEVRNGKLEISLLNPSTNTWVGSAVMAGSNTAVLGYAGSSVSLAGALDRVRITTVNGTDTFDAGSINILYE